MVYSFKYQKSCTICFLPSFFPMKNTGAIWGDFKVYHFLNYSSMNSYTSLLFSLDNGRYYTFFFLSTKPSFTSIAWFHNFFIGILLLAFFPKTWIYLWNLWGTNFLASSSDFAVFSSSSQISHSSATFFTSIILFFFCFSFSFLLSFVLSLIFLLLLLFLLFHPDFLCFGLHCFPYSSRHLIIFTSSILQSISGLWWASYGILKITLYFCSPITSISVLSLCLC